MSKEEIKTGNVGLLVIIVLVVYLVWVWITPTDSLYLIAQNQKQELTAVWSHGGKFWHQLTNETIVFLQRVFFDLDAHAQAMSRSNNLRLIVQWVDAFMHLVVNLYLCALIAIERFGQVLLCVLFALPAGWAIGHYAAVSFRIKRADMDGELPVLMRYKSVVLRYLSYLMPVLLIAPISISINCLMIVAGVWVMGLSDFFSTVKEGNQV